MTCCSSYASVGTFMYLSNRYIFVPAHKGTYLSLWVQKCSFRGRNKKVPKVYHVPMYSFVPCRGTAGVTKHLYLFRYNPATLFFSVCSVTSHSQLIQSKSNHVVTGATTKHNSPRFIFSDKLVSLLQWGWLFADSSCGSTLQSYSYSFYSGGLSITECMWPTQEHRKTCTKYNLIAVHIKVLYFVCFFYYVFSNEKKQTPDPTMHLVQHPHFGWATCTLL